MRAAELATKLATKLHVKRRGAFFDCLCPNHPDTNPSCSFSDGDEGIRFLCRAGCASKAVAVAMAALVPCELKDFFFDPGQRTNGQRPEIVRAFDYHTHEGEVVYQICKMTDGTYKARHPDGPAGWRWGMTDIPRVLYNLPELLGATLVLVAEGETDVETLRDWNLTGTTIPFGAKSFKPLYAELLAKVMDPNGVVAVLRDEDAPGRALQQQWLTAGHALGRRMKLIGLPNLPAMAGADVTDWKRAGHDQAELLALIEATGEWMPDMQADIDDPPELRPDRAADDGGAGPRPSPWLKAQPVPDFLITEDPMMTFLEPHLLARGVITEVFAPRGIGKSLVAHALLKRVADRGHRCLLIDRDNPRGEVRRRLHHWGAAATPQLYVITREHAPALKDKAAWGQFPAADYAVVCLDSLDSATEGAGEGDSAKPAVAIAPLLDLAHTAGGPALLILGNTIKSGKHNRGSGVIEDRADISYEVRDATDFRPSGTKDWWHELPEAGVGAWAERASRRKRRSKYRLAFIPSKYRVGEEPEPFCLELDLTVIPWTLRDVTPDLLQLRQQAQEEVARAQAETTEQAVDILQRIIDGREETGDHPLDKTEAEEVLHKAGLARKQARAALTEYDGKRWRIMQGKQRAKLMRSLHVTAAQLDIASP